MQRPAWLFSSSNFARENWLDSNIHEFVLYENILLSEGYVYMVYIKMSFCFLSAPFFLSSSSSYDGSWYFAVSGTCISVFVHVKEILGSYALFFGSLFFSSCLLLSIECSKMVYTKCKLHTSNKATTPPSWAAQKSGCQNGWWRETKWAQLTMHTRDCARIFFNSNSEY